jgi:hypothetical protein
VRGCFENGRQAQHSAVGEELPAAGEAAATLLRDAPELAEELLKAARYRREDLRRDGRGRQSEWLAAVADELERLRQ